MTEAYDNLISLFAFLRKNDILRGMSNTFGSFFRITSFGESHGVALGVVIDNCPPGVDLCEADIQKELDRRKPGQSAITTPRKEADTCEILSGVFEGKTTGTSIAVIVRNENQRSKDYDDIKDIFRPSHADFGYLSKYGIRDYRGGGRSSARETIARVMGGAIAQKVLKQKFPELQIFGFTRSIGPDYFETIDKNYIEENPLRMASKEDFANTLQKVEAIRDDGDSIGGTVEIRVENPPAGLGMPVFGKLESDLARAMMSVPAVKGFEIGEGFDLCEKLGSEGNDEFISDDTIHTKRNANGGILGGISTGDDIWFRVGIKPTSSISKPQKSVNKEGKTVDLVVKGRHDPILMPRAVPILEAMTALVLLDHVMMDKAQNHLI